MYVGFYLALFTVRQPNNDVPTSGMVEGLSLDGGQRLLAHAAEPLAVLLVHCGIEKSQSAERPSFLGDASLFVSCE